mmetsp:Transcript_16028/g.27627  ORF Transcript_16028/g.27627 Transcript_16028/m.27627 type:complete len:205 (+) Transcript_16028:1116-1730(+)
MPLAGPTWRASRDRRPFVAAPRRRPPRCQPSRRHLRRPTLPPSRPYGSPTPHCPPSSPARRGCDTWDSRTYAWMRHVSNRGRPRIGGTGRALAAGRHRSSTGERAGSPRSRGRRSWRCRRSPHEAATRRIGGVAWAGIGARHLQRASWLAAWVSSTSSAASTACQRDTWTPRQRQERCARIGPEQNEPGWRKREQLLGQWLRRH